MVNLKSFEAVLLTAFTVITQASPVLHVLAESETESDDHVKITAENEQSGNQEADAIDDSEAYVASDPAYAITSATLSAELFKGADKEDSGYIWHAKSNAKGHGVGYRVNYSTSGIADIPQGYLQIDVPMHIIKDRDDSYADTYEMALPSEEEFEETRQNDPDTVFTYKELDRDGDGENDTIRVYNKVQCPAGQNGYFELAYYTSEQTMDYKDMSATDPFKAVMSIGSKSWNTDEIPFTIDTCVSITSLSPYYPTRFTSWQSSWGG